MKNRIVVVLWVVFGVLAGIAVQRYWFGMQAMDKSPITPANSNKKVKFYRHPMNPAITSDKPLKDEMGMDYIPIYEEDGAAAPGAAVTISPSMVNNMGVRTEPAQRSRLSRRIDTVGYVSWDEELIHHVHLRFDGWIERQHVAFVGERVQKGELLFEVYAPKLASAQEEYLQALNSGNNFLPTSARARLRALGVTEDQIAALDKTRKAETLIKVYAPADGVVSALNVRPGMFVEPATETLSLVDTSTMWVLADIFERQAAWVANGQEAEVRLDSRPGQIWKGKVEYISPSLDPITRTLKARLRFDNPGEELKPNMYAGVTLYTGAGNDTLNIPREALIRTGTEQRVIVALGEGRFAQRTVQAGAEVADRVEIVSGLKEGEQVVTSGQFLIDSEASLKAGLQRLTSTDGDIAPKKSAHGRGVVKVLQGAEINISHEPIPSMNWPAMAMNFKLADPGLAHGLKLGDLIEFDFHEARDGYVIDKLSPVGGDRP